MQDKWDLLTKNTSQDERKAVQIQTFTRWMNAYLNRRDPPAEVHDLFRDLQDGRILMILLEELTGCKLLYRFRSSSHRIFRLNNISKALAFLDDRHVKLLGIDASAVADGVPSVVLNLVWNIILHFQVKDAAGGLHRRLSSSLSSLSTGSYPSSGDLSALTDDTGGFSCNILPSQSRTAAKEPKYNGKAIQTLLQWVQRCTAKFGVEVHDFGKSWRSGLAFLALIKSLDPVLVDLRKSLTKEPRENIEQAFSIAHQNLGIPPLLEPEDVTCSSPDEKSVITYVSMFLRHCPDMAEDQSAVNSPHMSKFRSLETLVDTKEAQILLSSFEESNELLLWKRWARRSSGGSHSNPSLQKERRSSSVLQPPSPLDAGVVNPEIRSWLDKSSDQGYNWQRADELYFSLSPEKGIYNVTPLDSDEEDAYSYILDLNKDVFQSQPKRQVPRVEEETAEELSRIGQSIGKTLEICRNCDSEVETTTQRDLDLEGLERECKEMTTNGNDINHDEDERDGEDVKKDGKEERPMEKVENVRPVKQVKRQSPKEKPKKETPEDLHNSDVTAERNLKAPSNSILTEHKTFGDKTLRDHSKENAAELDDLTEDLTVNVKVQNNKNEHRNLNDCNTNKIFIEEVVDEMCGQAKGKDSGGNMNHLTCPDRNTENADELLHDWDNGLDKSGHQRSTPSSLSTSLSGSGVLRQSSTPSCGLSPVELKVLLLLWILLYCCFIGHQLI